MYMYISLQNENSAILRIVEIRFVHRDLI